MRLALVFVVYQGNLRVARLYIEWQHVFLRMQFYELGTGITRGGITGLDDLAPDRDGACSAAQPHAP